MYGEDCQESFNHFEWVADFEEIVTQVRQELVDQGRGDEFQGAKVIRVGLLLRSPDKCIQIIYSTVKNITPEELKWYTDDVIALKKAFPKTIAGFDLVGYEDGLRPLSDYLPELLAFKERVVSERLDLPLILHAGETLSDGGAPDGNLYDAILLGTKRLGHG
jgi:adenosine deaminase CECR1